MALAAFWNELKVWFPEACALIELFIGISILCHTGDADTSIPNHAQAAVRNLLAVEPDRWRQTLGS
jgi:hypothetical protein